jgi:hypothetical protein
MLKRAGLAVSAALALTFTAPLAAAPEGNVTYKMESGDTLLKLADTFFLKRDDFQTVMRVNKIRDARRIPVGASIKIPRRLLRFEPVDLRVRSLSGPVSVTTKGKSAKPKLGRLIREGDEIRTGRNGFISIAGRGNSRLTLPSNSRARFIDARRYLINDKIDIQIRVLEGRGEVRAPKLKGQERYRVGTPVAVTAVRGTEFRVGYDPEAALGLTEVDEGNVAVANDGRSVAAEAGFGVTASPAGVRDVEELLPAPSIVEPGKLQTSEDVSFTITPMDGAKGYRTQIAKDAGFLEIVEEAVAKAPVATLGKLEDGRYFVRARAIATSGLEGKSDIYSFRRKRVGVSAEASSFDDAFKFAWSTQGSGPSYVAFQLWEEGNRERLLVDEIGLTESNLYIDNLENGSYRWRVANFQIDSGEVIKVWGPVQQLNVTE